MVLVDTSVWIDHFRHGNRQLSAALENQEVLIHSFVVGELACGHLKQRTLILDLLKKLPAVGLASHEEALHFLEQNELMGRGIGYVDVHLLAASALAVDAPLWSRDRRLNEVARTLGLGYVSDR